LVFRPTPAYPLDNLVGRLEAVSYHLAHLSVFAVQEFYEQAYQDCRLVYNRLPSPGKVQTLAKSGSSCGSGGESVSSFQSAARLNNRRVSVKSIRLEPPFQTHTALFFFGCAGLVPNRNCRGRRCLFVSPTRRMSAISVMWYVVVVKVEPSLGVVIGGFP
jgi:hypothetical protein